MVSYIPYGPYGLAEKEKKMTFKLYIIPPAASVPYGAQKRICQLSGADFISCHLVRIIIFRNVTISSLTKLHSQFSDIYQWKFCLEFVAKSKIGMKICQKVFAFYTAIFCLQNNDMHLFLNVFVDFNLKKNCNWFCFVFICILYFYQFLNFESYIRPTPKNTIQSF